MAATTSISPTAKPTSCRCCGITALRWSTRSRTSSHDELAYTTVLTILRTLEQKGYVKHEEEGRVHRYSAAVKEDAARKSALQHLTGKLFKGSAELLFTHLVVGPEAVEGPDRAHARAARRAQAGRRSSHARLDALRDHGDAAAVGRRVRRRARRCACKRGGTRWIWLVAIVASLCMPTVARLGAILAAECS